MASYNGRAQRQQQLRLPIHDYAQDHKLLQLIKIYKTKRRLEWAAERRPCAEVAAERIREYAWDLGAEKDWHRWIAESARKMGMSYSTVHAIVTGKITRVGPKVVDQISRVTGIPVGVFYDEET